MKQTKRVLSVVLALAMVFAMSIMVSAATPACTSKVKVEDKTVTVTLYGTGADLQTFDYGIAYDTEKLEFSKVKWNSAVFAPEDGDEYASKTANNQGTYVVIGGTHTGEFIVADGALIATVTFTAKADVAEVEKAVGVIADSAAVVDDKFGGDVTKLTIDSAKEAGVEVVPPVVDAPPVESADPAKSADPATSAAPSAAPSVAPSADPAKSADPATSAAPSAAPSVAPSAAASVKPTTAPSTADTASVVVPVVAICAAAAAVVVASKKRVED